MAIEQWVTVLGNGHHDRSEMQLHLSVDTRLLLRTLPPLCPPRERVWIYGNMSVDSE
jgi:hypothetical protein